LEINVDFYTIISCFSGIGGLDLGVSAVIPTRTIAYIEREITCAAILAKRGQEGLLDVAPIYSDIKSFPAENYAGKIHGVIGGFPCQPFSVAGKQTGEEDDRNLWPDTIKLIRTLRPQFVFLENVPALISNEYFGTILGDLAESGFDAEWGCFKASEIGASHKRERVFILAYTQRNRIRGWNKGLQPKNRSGGATSTTPIEGSGSELADSKHDGFIATKVTDGQSGTIDHRCEERKDNTRQPTGVHSPRNAPEKLADSDSNTKIRAKWTSRIGKYSEDLADTDSIGTQGSPTGKQSAKQRFVNDNEEINLPEFPPKPDDPEWEWIISQHPELAPAQCKLHETESEVCDVADAWKVKDTMAALMMLGNAVVPHQAAYALKVLLDRK
jgi:DNA (cytosine-5)-methyltransferase 1